MKLIPYLYFQGDCEEALNKYKEILNGKLEIVNRYDNPAMKAPDDYKNKILHARLSTEDIEIYASDVMPGKSSKDRVSSNVFLSLDVSNHDKGKELFDKLSDGGRIRVPFEKQFWGAWHGNLVDKFGISWMVNCES